MLIPPSLAFNLRQILAIVDGSGPCLPNTFFHWMHCDVMFRSKSPTFFTISVQREKKKFKLNNG